MSDRRPELERARRKWRFTGETRPGFAVEPAAGQESVWDHPRPPQVEQDGRRVKVVAGSVTVADTRSALRVLETAGPPVFYIPPDDLRTEYLRPSRRASLCEWKGQAEYWSVAVGERTIADAAWSYPSPLEGYEAIAAYLSFYPAKIDCWVDGQRVEPQPGSFYGGWVTPEIVGPFKGTPGTEWW